MRPLDGRSNVGQVSLYQETSWPGDPSFLGLRRQKLRLIFRLVRFYALAATYRYPPQKSF